ncbi:MAG: hypothetical protein IPO17_17520 [Flavobacteriales bacterium]|nr:hypothetical protein [Flavobacteriales bacterium]MBK9196743.1 hypothetical protein [Flavobacteriales bacterium]
MMRREAAGEKLVKAHEYRRLNEQNANRSVKAYEFKMQNISAVLDLSGKVLAQYSESVRSIASPEVAGTYLVRGWYADGRTTTERLVQY